MPLKYKEPKWEHTKKYARHYFGNFEHDLFIKAIEQIPQGAECKITIQWSRSEHQKEMDKYLKDLKKLN